MVKRSPSNVLWIAIGLVGFLAISRSFAPPDPVVVRTRQFSTFSEPTAETLRVEYHGGLGGPPIRFVLYGDKRLSGDSFELRLSDAEAARLVQAVLDASEFQSLYRHEMATADSTSNPNRRHPAATLVTIYLESYRVQGGKVASPYLRQFEISASSAAGEGRYDRSEPDPFEAATNLLLEAQEVAVERQLSTRPPVRPYSFRDFSSNRRYSLYEDSETEILRIEHRGDSSARWGLFQLFGDGRLVLGITNSASAPRPIESYEINLDRKEMRALIDPLVHSGFMETNDQLILSAAKRSQVAPDLAGGARGGVESLVELRLVNYSGIDGKVLAETRSRLQVSSPHGLARAFPEIEELQGIARTHDSLVRIGLRARQRALVGAPVLVPRTRGSQLTDSRAAIVISDDPSQAILRLSRFASESAGREIYTLYGDGRLEKTYKELGLDSTLATVELDDDTLSEIVQTAIRGGLLTTSQTELRESIRATLQEENRRLAKLGRPPSSGPIASGSGHSSVEISIERFGHLGGHSNRLTLLDLDRQSATFPQIRELEAWTHLLEELKYRIREPISDSRL
jgi:hypothetical protein